MKTKRKTARNPKAKKTSKAASRKTTKPARSGASLQLGEDIWPLEADVLFRPDRLKYVRKMIKPQGCVFCNALAQGPGPETLLLYKGERAMVVLNKFPYNPGHLLVLPTRHCGDILAMEKEELHEIQDLIQFSIRVIAASSQPAGFNVGLNLGAASGAGIPEHLHYHIVPRWSGDTNFFPLLAGTKVVVETLEQTYDRLLPYFEGRTPAP